MNKKRVVKAYLSTLHAKEPALLLDFLKSLQNQSSQDLADQDIQSLKKHLQTIKALKTAF